MVAATKPSNWIYFGPGQGLEGFSKRDVVEMSAFSNVSSKI